MTRAWLGPRRTATLTWPPVHNTSPAVHNFWRVGARVHDRAGKRFTTLGGRFTVWITGFGRADPPGWRSLAKVCRLFQSPRLTLYIHGRPRAARRHACSSLFPTMPALPPPPPPSVHGSVSLSLSVRASRMPYLGDRESCAASASTTRVRFTVSPFCYPASRLLLFFS